MGEDDAGEALVFLGQSEKFGIDWLLAGTAHRFEGDVQRGYRNGTAIAASHGSTEGHGYGVMARLGWNVPGPVQGMRFRPYGSLSHTAADVDGWTETTGPLPLSIDGFSDKATSARLGVDARWNVDARTTLWSGIAWGHRFGGGNPRITGRLGSSFTASSVGTGPGSDWIDLNAGARFSVTESLFATVSASAAVPFGGDATARGRVGFVKSF